MLVSLTIALHACKLSSNQHQAVHMQMTDTAPPRPHLHDSGQQPWYMKGWILKRPKLQTQLPAALRVSSSHPLRRAEASAHSIVSIQHRKQMPDEYMRVCASGS